LAIRLIRKSLCACAFIFLIQIAVAEGTRTWEQSKFDELTKGTTDGVAVRSKGGLELAPAFTPLATTPSTYIWAIASDQQGDVYAAAGAPARVYRITPEGKFTTIFEPKELQVQALVVDKAGAVYAATNPDGKIYRIEHLEKQSGAKSSPAKSLADSSWTSSVFFDPNTKYIWDLLLDQAGNLYVATGDHGEIFRVTPKGEHSVFFKSDEAHIRVLALDPHGNVIAGSDGSGLIYRISPDGQAFVLYSAPKKEITALAVDAKGNIYAAGGGEKRSNAGPFIQTIPVISMPNANPQKNGITISPLNPNTPVVLSNFPAPGSETGGSEIYKLDPDGSPTSIWSSHDDLVYALAFDQQGRLLAGSGNHGRIFAISGEDDYADLLHASASQVTAFAKAPNGGVYAATSNLGKVFLLSASPDGEGTYESDVYDAQIFSRWGRLEFRGSGNVDIFARSGNVDNPDRNWSPWKQVDLTKFSEIGAPPARFIQWKAALHPGNPPPVVDDVIVNYLPKNVAPDFDDVTVQVGVRYQALPKPPQSADTSGGNSQPHFDAPPPTIHDSDSIGVKWAVHDANDDDMVYSVYYKGDGESRWLLLKDGITDKFYSFDAALLPDGGYTIKVVASDAPSHSPGQELTADRESSRFEVDTTPPQIESLAATLEGNQIHVTFRGVDSFSNIKRAEYSLDASDWQYIEPVDWLSDAKTESYDFKAPVPSDSQDPPAALKSHAGAQQETTEHIVVVRVYDQYDNMSSAKAIIRGK
jgi:sugar lactone lactonase YvrE